MLDHFFEVVNTRLGKAEVLHLHTDSCTGQNKNNIVLGYLMLRVGHGLHDEIVWHFMEVGHTKFRPDEGFGNIRQHVGIRSNVLSIGELVSAIEASAISARCVLFPVEHIRNWKAVSDTFHFLAGLRKFFAYKIHIRAVVENDARRVIVDVYRDPKGSSPDVSKNLLKSGKHYPPLSSFEHVVPRKLTRVRRESLRDDVYSVLKRNRVKMSAEAQEWWEEEIIGSDICIDSTSKE